MIGENSNGGIIYVTVYLLIGILIAIDCTITAIQ